MSEDDPHIPLEFLLFWFGSYSDDVGMHSKKQCSHICTRQGLRFPAPYSPLPPWTHCASTHWNWPSVVFTSTAFLLWFVATRSAPKNDKYLAAASAPFWLWGWVGMGKKKGSEVRSKRVEPVTGHGSISFRPLTLSFPRVINFKFPLQPHQK